MNRWPPLRLILACSPTMISRHFLKDIHMHLSNRLFLEIIFDIWILWDGQWTQIHAPCWICFVLSLLKTSKIKIFVHLCLPLLLFLKCCDHTWKIYCRCLLIIYILKPNMFLILFSVWLQLVPATGKSPSSKCKEFILFFLFCFLILCTLNKFLFLFFFVLYLSPCGWTVSLTPP